MSLQLRATLLLLLLAVAAAAKPTNRPKHLVFMLADGVYHFHSTAVCSLSDWPKVYSTSHSVPCRVLTL